MRESRDPLGRRETIEYDDASLPTLVRRFDADGNLMAQAESSYDVRKRLSEQSDWIWPNGERDPEDPPLDVPPGDAGVAVTRFEYDGLSNLKKTIDPLGRETFVFYDAAERQKRAVDAAGNEIESYFDPAGNPMLVRSREVVPGGGSVDVTELRKFDAVGRPVEVTNGAGETVRTMLDARGNPRFVIDPVGHFTEMRYDGLDRMTFRARPEGITEKSIWDAASRLRTYRDALGNETTWSYDALNRVRGIAYQDSTTRTFEYDETGNVVEQNDPSGTRTVFGYDDAGQLTSRTYEPGEGIEGPVAESFELDGLGRVVRAHSGLETTERSYDSLSRMLSETIDVRTVESQYNFAGDRITLTYPSGKIVTVGPDALGRPGSIAHLEGDLSVPKAAYGFRGPDLVQSLGVGDGLSWSRQFDGARRPTVSTLTGESDRPLFGEDHIWSARGLRQSTARADANDAALRFDYDGAGRLTRARRSVIEGEQAIPASGWPGLPEEFSFGYDAADNLLSKLEQSACEPETVSLPLDGSGRNRPGAIGEIDLSWSDNGNLALDGDRRFVYDAKDRLVAVEDASTNARLVEYRYDAFDRRIGKTLLTGLTEETVWDGWQPIELYRNGELASRRTYGWGLDEVVSLEQDVDWSPGVEEEYVPVYDETGNVALLVRPDGQVVERYEYGPYGERWILVDSTPPAVEQVRTEGDELWIELSEEVRLDELERAKAAGTLIFTNLTDGSPVDFELELPVEQGRNARKRLVLKSQGDPADSFWPEAGETASLTIPGEVFVDLFGNEASEGIDRSFTATGASQLLDDTAAPGVVQICVSAEGRLEVTLDEEPAVAGWASVARVDGSPLAWELSADRYTVRTTAPVATGTHDLAILDFGDVDLDGKPLIQSITTAFEISEGSGVQTLYALPIPGEVEISTVGNVLGFQGLTHDPETDLVYIRNRYLDPRMGRFLTADPMGYADGPSLYAFTGNNPVDRTDPLGLSWVAEGAQMRRDRGTLGGGDADQLLRASVEALSNPYVQGGLQVVGGCTTAAIGGAGVLTGAGVVPGGAALAYGADMCGTGISTLVLGETQETLFAKGVRSGLLATGMDPTTAHWVTLGVDLGAGVGVNAALAASLSRSVRFLGSAPKGAQSPNPILELQRELSHVVNRQGRVVDRWLRSSNNRWADLYRNVESSNRNFTKGIRGRILDVRMRDYFRRQFGDVPGVRIDQRIPGTGSSLRPDLYFPELGGRRVIFDVGSRSKPQDMGKYAGMADELIPLVPLNWVP